MGLLDNSENTNWRTPFKLAFSTKAVIPSEIGVSNLRQAHYDKGTNNEKLKLSFDCLVEIRDEATLRMARYQQKMQEYYNQRVKLRRFNLDNMVLRKVSQATRDPAQGMLGPFGKAHTRSSINLDEKAII